MRVSRAFPDDIFYRFKAWPHVRRSPLDVLLPKNIHAIAGEPFECLLLIILGSDDELDYEKLSTGTLRCSRVKLMAKAQNNIFAEFVEATVW